MTENQPLTVKYLDTAEACMETYRKKQTLCHMDNFQISLIYAFIWCPLSVIKMCNTHKDLRIIQGKSYQNTVVSVLLLQFFFTASIFMLAKQIVFKQCLGSLLCQIYAHWCYIYYCWQQRGLSGYPKYLTS